MIPEREKIKLRWEEVSDGEYRCTNAEYSAVRKNDVEWHLYLTSDAANEPWRCTSLAAAQKLAKDHFELRKMAILMEMMMQDE